MVISYILQEDKIVKLFVGHTAKAFYPFDLDGRAMTGVKSSSPPIFLSSCPIFEILHSDGQKAKIST